MTEGWRVKLLILIWELALAACDGYAQTPAEKLPVFSVPCPVGQFTLFADPRSRTAFYAAEHLTPAVLKGDAERKRDFAGDPCIPFDWRATASDYDSPDYDAGHLAPAADYGNQAANNATFVITNAVPQDSSLNRGWWAQLEDQVRQMVDAHHEAYVVTLPLYLPNEDHKIEIRTIGKRRVWVPTDIAKAVLVIRDGEPLNMFGWLVPNSHVTADDVLHSFRVPVDEIEFDAGLDLFAWLPDKLEEKLESTKP